MARLRPDFASGKLSDASLSSSVTVLDSPQFATLPLVASPDTITLVLDPLAVYGAQERVTVTAHSSAATSVTVVRGSDGPVTGLATRTHNQAGVQETWQVSVTDQDFVHGTLSTLSTNDHPQYLLINGSAPMTGLLTAPAGIAVTGGTLSVGGSMVVAAGAMISSGPAVTTDCVGITVFSTPAISMPVLSGATYLVSLNASALQVTAASTSSYVGVGSDDGRLLFGAGPVRAFSSPLAPPAEVSGGIVCAYSPAASRTTTFGVSGYSSAGALRVPPGQIQLIVWRIA